MIITVVCSLKIRLSQFDIINGNFNHDMELDGNIGTLPIFIDKLGGEGQILVFDKIIELLDENSSLMLKSRTKIRPQTVIHPKACFICAYIPNRANLSPHFRYNPVGREPTGVPKGQHYFPDNVVFEAEYWGTQPYTSSTIEVVIYEKDRNLCSTIINWGQIWKK